MSEIYIGMKRDTIERLRDELTKALDGSSEEEIIDVTMYGDVDETGFVLHINNDDMERDEIPDNAIYVEAEED